MSIQSHPRRSAADRVMVVTSAGVLFPVAQAFRKRSGWGYVRTHDQQVLEVVQRGGAWHAVKRVDPRTLPAPVQRHNLLGDMEQAVDRWLVDQCDHVYVVLTFGSFGGLEDLRDRLPWGSRAWRGDGSTRERAAAIRLASELVGLGSISTTRVALVHASVSGSVDIGDGGLRIVWSS